MNLGAQEILIILFLAGLIFGGKQLPKLANSLGRGVRAYKRETGELASMLAAIKVRELSVTQGESPLSIFVSSRMDELSVERMAALKAINKIPLARAWVFEFTPPSSEKVEESYLHKVEQCDIFILIIGETISPPVMREYEAARAARKPCLIFIKDCEREPEADAFVSNLSLKSPRFSTPEGLAHILTLALLDELIRGYREGRHKNLSAVDFSVLVATLELLTGEGDREAEGASDERRRVTAEGLLVEATKLRKAHDYGNAAKLLTQAIYLDPSNDKALGDRGNCFNNLGHFKEAVADLKGALSIAPNNIKNLLRLGIVYYNTGKYEQAVEISNKALAVAPHGAESYLAYAIRGDSYVHGLNRGKDGREDLEKSLKLVDQQRLLNPSDNLLLLRRGDILLGLLRVGEALEDCRTYVAKERRDAYGHYRLGTLYELQGDKKKAARSYRESMSLRPSYWSTLSEELLRELN